MRRILFLLCLILLSAGSARGISHGHTGYSHLHHHRSVHATFGDSEAARKVSGALEALRVLNKLRYENIQYNRYELADSSLVSGERVTAAPLDYSPENVQKLSSMAASFKGESVDDSSRKRDSSTSPDSQSFAYSIPPDLAEAARILAESAPPSPSTGKESALAAKMQAKYGLKGNDTNVASQSLRGPDGLLEYAPSVDMEAPIPVTDKFREKRAASGSDYWMANMEQRGASPYAPEGYKVWRNVKDYGAKGDGLTDDTAAINKAISDGGRCGADCGSSTIYPAVVYFPPGKYLVSSPIIQYYNTQFLGDPTNYPTILAAASFVGLGVITSDVYVGDQQEWYLNTNNFLRNIRNFKMDITRTDPAAYVCAIHWQVAQGTSLENIEFYMSQDAGTTQQGLYMENGSGGFMSNLTFVGGNFGAYLGNQQFTTQHLVFVNCKTALQIHWDWAWTMQDVVIESCQTGIVVTGGAGGPMSNGQGVGSFILVDAVIANTPTGILTSLYSANSTAFLLQNVGFYNVEKAIVAERRADPILLGGNEVLIDAWGFGLYAQDANIQFAQQKVLPAMQRAKELVSSNSYNKGTFNFFTRRRPQYTDIGHSQVFDVKAYGAKGDGVTDDTIILNSVFTVAANLSSIVYVPHGIYKVTDTLKIPKGSRIVGQAWSQIMATGAKFRDADHPHVAVQVGHEGESGIVEIQDLLFTVSGPTAGAVLVEWNIHESSQGSAGLWDSHFRVGGAKGSNLRASECPKKQFPLIKQNCIAASLLLRITPSASAYLENVWAWTADHDLDVKSQDQIDVFSARGILVESHGPTWMYGTASEHNVLYQYQLSGAQKIVMGMIQTETPYFQPLPAAPEPFKPGLFPNDPDFTNCGDNIAGCAMAWAVRVIDSSTVYMLGSGLYSWFAFYTQDCVETGNCQERGFYVEQSTDTWVYNLVTKGITESISPTGEIPLYARDVQNGYTSSLLAWLHTGIGAIGKRKFPGFYLWDDELDQDVLSGVSSTCKASLTRLVECHDQVYMLRALQWRGSMHNDTLTDLMCDKTCGQSLQAWFESVSVDCAREHDRVALSEPGGIIWAGWNETCVKDPNTGKYCGDIIDGFTVVQTIADMPQGELCSHCYVTRYEMMQATPYSMYDETYKSDLEFMHSKCGLSGPTNILPPLQEFPDPYKNNLTFCISETTYTAISGDTCDSISLKYSVSSASLYMGNPNLHDCRNIPAGTELCIPLSCNPTYTLKDNDTCISVEASLGLPYSAGATLRKFNPWLLNDCSNLHMASNQVYGHVLCGAPQGGTATGTAPPPGVTSLPQTGGYTETAPPTNATVAKGTTFRCGKWYVVPDAEAISCTMLCMQGPVDRETFLRANPSLAAGNCDGLLVAGDAYCVGPVSGFDATNGNSTASSTSMETT